MTCKLIQGDCTEILPTLESESVDAVICDPPYPMIHRSYGMMAETEWWDMMMIVCKDTRRILKPTGSAVFILQPNSKHVGQMRGWLFEFQAWVCREWNMVQDAWWWNTASLPCGGAITDGLLRSSMKACVWVGNPSCYRNQNDVLWKETNSNYEQRARGRTAVDKSPSGRLVNRAKMHIAAKKRGGVTPYNVLPFSNNYKGDISAGSYGHGAGTPYALADWWTRYISPPGGVVADWFTGSGTMGLAALQNGRSFIGIERDAGYCAIAERRLAECEAKMAENGRQYSFDMTEEYHVQKHRSDNTWNGLSRS